MQRSRRWLVPGIALLVLLPLFFVLRAPEPLERLGPDLRKISSPVPKPEAELNAYLPRPLLNVPYRDLTYPSPQTYHLSPHRRLEYVGDKIPGDPRVLYPQKIDVSEYRLVLVDTQSKKSTVLQKWKPYRAPYRVLLSPDKKQALWEEYSSEKTTWTVLSLSENPKERRWRIPRKPGEQWGNVTWLPDSRHWALWKTRMTVEQLDKTTRTVIPSARLSASLFIAGVASDTFQPVADLLNTSQYPVYLGPYSGGNVLAVAPQTPSSPCDLTLGEDQAGVGAYIVIRPKSLLQVERLKRGKAQLSLIVSHPPEYEEITKELTVTIPPPTNAATLRLSPNGRYLLWTVKSDGILHSPSEALRDWFPKQFQPKQVRPPAFSLWLTDLQTGNNSLLGILPDPMSINPLKQALWTQDGKAILWQGPAVSGHQEKRYGMKSNQWFQLSVPAPPTS